MPLDQSHGPKLPSDALVLDIVKVLDQAGIPRAAGDGRNTANTPGYSVSIWNYNTAAVRYIKIGETKEPKADIDRILDILQKHFGKPRIRRITNRGWTTIRVKVA